MRWASSVVVLALIICSLVSLPESASSICPTYQTNLQVDFLDASAHNVHYGEPVVMTVHIIYNDGTPVTLSPQTLSFILSGSKFKKTFDNVPVIPTGKPGYYTYTFTVADNYPTGSIDIAVGHCCASDKISNYGPTQDTDSAITITYCNSVINVGTSTPTLTSSTSQQLTPTFAQVIAAYAVPLVIIVLLALAAILSTLRLGARQKTR